jgi:hypothetical protein
LGTRPAGVQKVVLVGERGGGGPPRGHTPLSVGSSIGPRLGLRGRLQQLRCCSLAGRTLAETARAHHLIPCALAGQVWVPCASPQTTGG